MRLLIALILLAIVLGSGSSRASDAPHATPPAAAAPSGGPLAGSGKPGIDMPALFAPVTVNGELHYYLYLAIRLNVANDSQRTLVLEKIPYIQDAFLREVHRASLALGDDPDTIDGHGLTDRLLKEAERVVGPGVVVGLEFRNMVRSRS
jgi:hypothetical protein